MSRSIPTSVLPEGIDQRLGEIETALAELDERPVQYDADEIARAGAFVSIDASGALRIERGYVRPEDEPAVPQAEGEADAERSATPAATSASGDTTEGQTGTSADTEEPDQEEGIKPIPDRLMTELTAYRTLALRDALAGDPDVAFLAALHALCLKLFYRYTPESCLDIDAKSVVFGSQAPGLGDTAIAKAVDERHRRWSEQLPRESAELWDALANFDRDSRDALFAHCIALSINAVYEPWNRRPRALAHADRLAEAIGLDVAAAGLSPTVDNYFGRVTKARILQAVREAKGETAAQLIEHLKKGEMADRAQELLTGSGWLPEPLRTPGRPSSATSPAPESGPISPSASGEDAPMSKCEAAMPDVKHPLENDAALTDEPLVAAE
jgi:ParB family chromosome partitioning protein